MKITEQPFRGKAYTPEQKRLKVLSKQQSKKENGENIMTSKEVQQAETLGFLGTSKEGSSEVDTHEDVTNNRGEEARHSHSHLPRSTNDRPGMERKRGGFAGTSQKLSITKSIPGYHLHIFNDDGIRIEEAISVGWEFVQPDEVGRTAPHVTSRNTDLGNKVRFTVGKKEGGEPLYAYLMKIREEWWLEDQALQQSRNDLIDEQILSGKDTKTGKQGEGFYVGREGIKIQQG